MELLQFLHRTMLVERLCGVGIYFLALVIVCNGIFIGSSVSATKRWLKAYLITLCVMAYFFIPPDSADLTRLWNHMHILSSHDFDWLIEQCRNSTYASYYLMFWLIGKTGNDSLLPAIACFIFFGLYFACFSDYAERHNCSGRNTSLALFVYMCLGTFITVISGIRYSLASVFVLRSIYTEVECERKPLFNLPYYLLAISMHSMGIVLILLRILSELAYRSEKKTGTVTSFVLSVGSVCILLRYGNAFLDAMIDKADGYISGTAYSNNLARVAQFAWNLFIIHSLFLVSSCYRQTSDMRLRNLALFPTLCLIISLLFTFIEFSIFYRFSIISSMYIPFFVMTICSHNEIEKFRSYKDTVGWAAALMLAFMLTRGDLTAYKFFVI